MVKACLPLISYWHFLAFLATFRRLNDFTIKSPTFRNFTKGLRQVTKLRPFCNMQRCPFFHLGNFLQVAVALMILKQSSNTRTDCVCGVVVARLRTGEFMYQPLHLPFICFGYPDGSLHLLGRYCQRSDLCLFS